MRIAQFLTTISGTLITETELILAGSAVAAIAIAIATYVGVSKRQSSSSSVAVSDASDSFALLSESAVQTETSEKKIEDFPRIPTLSVTHSISSEASVANAPIQEAPSPFPEEFVPAPGTPAPTDVTALTKIASPIAGTSQGVLVIPATKRRARTKRLPAGGTAPVQRKKRSLRNKPVLPETRSIAFAESEHSITDTPQGFPEAQPTDNSSNQKE